MGSRSVSYTVEAHTGENIRTGIIEVAGLEFTVTQLGTKTEIPPTAQAGADRTVEAGAVVILSASGSSDSDGSIVSYLWEQTSGSPGVTIVDADRDRASFDAPQVGTDTTLTFRLTVTDDDGLTDTDEVMIQVTAGPSTTYPTEAKTFATYDGQYTLALTYSGASFVSASGKDPHEAGGSGKPDQLPYGLADLRFTVSPGSTFETVVYFPFPLDPEAKWYDWNAADGWSDYSIKADIAPDRRSATLTITDGGEGDADGTQDGYVAHYSGPGIAVSVSGSGGSSGCVYNPSGGLDAALVALILFAGFAAVRRRLSKRPCRTSR